MTIASGERPLPGDPDVWFFVVADMFGFAFLFGLFLAGRSEDPALYEQSRHALSLGFGLADTLILLSSGALMAGTVRLARAGHWSAATRGLRCTMAVGSTFALSKGFEWWSEIDAGNTPVRNEFFTYYFALTGIHLLHFVIGMVVLLILDRAIRSKNADTARLRWLEAAGAYWHAVDLLWVFIFAMLYLS